MHPDYPSLCMLMHVLVNHQCQSKIVQCFRDKVVELELANTIVKCSNQGCVCGKASAHTFMGAVSLLHVYMSITNRVYDPDVLSL